MLCAALAIVGAGCAKRSAVPPVAPPQAAPAPAPSGEAVSAPVPGETGEDTLGIDAEVDRLMDAVDSEDETLAEESEDANDLNADADVVSSFTDSSYVE